MSETKMVERIGTVAAALREGSDRLLEANCRYTSAVLDAALDDLEAIRAAALAADKENSHE